MPAATGPTEPLACVSDAIPAAERAAHFALLERLFGEAVLERVELEEGVAFRFSDNERNSLTRFAANERKCCPFLEIEIDPTPAGDGLWLRLTGPAGARALLETVLPTKRG
jgi:hypothetical protein